MVLIRTKVRLYHGNIFKKMDELNLKTIRQLAKLSGVNEGTLSSCLNFRIKFSKNVADKVAAVLGMKVEDILLGYEKFQKDINNLPNKNEAIFDIDSTDIYMLNDAEYPTLMLEEDIFRNEDFKIEVKRILSTLTPREAQMISLYYGLDGDEKTINEIAAIYDLTRERVRQIIEKAIRRMKHKSRSRLLKKFLE